MFSQPRYNSLSFKTHIRQSQPPSPTLHPLISIYTSHYSSLHHPLSFSVSSPHWFDSQIVFVLEGAKASVQAVCITFQQSKFLHSVFIFSFPHPFFPSSLSKFYLADRLIGWIKMEWNKQIKAEIKRQFRMCSCVCPHTSEQWPLTEIHARCL